MKKEILLQIRRRVARLPGLGVTEPVNANFPQNFTVGSACRIQGNPRIETVPDARIVCDSNVVLNSDPNGYHAGMSFPVTLIADRPGAEIMIGEKSRLHGCCIHAWSRIKIGRQCLLAAGSQVLDAHGHATELELARLRTRIQDKPEPVEIGDYCWIGLGALILKGVHLGEGCIVGAYSVVMAGEYPPFSLLAGSPARVVRSVKAEDVYPENFPPEQAAIDGKTLYDY